MDRVILHCDMNNFFASVECIGKPELQKRPVAVCGDPNKRHGIVLAKNEAAKKFGVKTGEPLVHALAKCPDIVFLPAHYRLYTHYSQAMRDIYRRYTDQIESFGIDECWLDVSQSRSLFGSGETIADELRALAKKELGLTISAGVSYNKIFAKMGSDYKKPDATTLITRDNFKELLWPLPIEEMLFVGGSSARKLRLFGVQTIGEAANMPIPLLEKYFGLPGLHLRECCNGNDTAPVAEDSYRRTPESVGNSVTCPYDIEEDGQARTVLFMLCDSVATRLRRHDLKCTTVTLSLRGVDLRFRSVRKKLSVQTYLATVLFEAAFALYRENRRPGEKLRGLGVTAEKLCPASAMQLSLFDHSFQTAKREKAEETVDALRARFGCGVIGGALYLTHPELTADHPLGHRFHPGGYDDSKGFPGEV